MRSRIMHAGVVQVAVIVLIGGCAMAANVVQVDLKNVSGEAKTNWPVILRVYTVFGRNLDPAFAADGIDVRDPSGKRAQYRIEQIPPYDRPGNNEIILVIPKIEPGQTLSYRFSHSDFKVGSPPEIDAVNSPHNLIANGEFEAAEGDRAKGFSAPAKRDTQVKRSGDASLMLTADGQEISTQYSQKIPLHKDSWYYFGVWSKTDNVSRFGYQAGSAAHFRLQTVKPDPKDSTKTKTVAAFRGGITPQCSTRPWVKAVMEGGVTEWGNDRYTAQAAEAECTLEFVLQQRKHFYMEPGKTRGRWWLDGAVLMEQPEVNVRFDLALKPLMKDGMFLFTRPPLMPLGRLDENKRGQPEWCAMPYPHEKLTALDKFALKGQRVSFCIGLYHTREMKDVLCRVAGGALTAGESRLPVELIEYCPGYLGPDRRRYMQVLFERVGDLANELLAKVTPEGQTGVRYFFITFNVPADAKAGKYTGLVELSAQGEKIASVPLVLRVQDMVQPTPTDAFVGMIHQGGNPRWDDEALRVYARSGFNCITRFGNFLDFEKDAQGKWQVNLDALHKRMMWIKRYGFAAVAVFSDFDVGPKWNGGRLLKLVRPANFNEGTRTWAERLETAAEAYKRQIARIEAARKAHPEWPTLIYMTFDEPNLGGGRNGLPVPAMGWVNQVAPDALTTLDVQFDPLPVCLKWYTAPAFDDPANWAGPELYRWIKKQGKQVGFCGAADKDEAARYQAGWLMITSGAKYFHAWHLTGGHIAGQVAYDPQTKKLLRAPAMINWGDGMNDLKCHFLLKAAMAEAEKSSDPKRRAALKAAQESLAEILKVLNGDHKDRWSLQPYLGTAFSWGYERFYDDWQERLARHAAALKGLRWVE